VEIEITKYSKLEVLELFGHIPLALVTDTRTSHNLKMQAKKNSLFGIILFNGKDTTVYWKLAV